MGNALSVGKTTIANGIDNNLIQVGGESTAYVATYIQNKTDGASSSTDITAGNDSDNANLSVSHFIDVGVNSSTYNDPNFTAETANDTYAIGYGGNLLLGTATAGKSIKFITGGTLAANVRATLSDTGLSFAGAFTSASPTAGVGYSTGAGGTVTQGTSKSTGVTLNTVSGQVVMNNAALAAGTSVSFTLTNSAIAATDVVIPNISSAATTNSYSITVDAVATGSCRIQLKNTSASPLSEAVVINFAVIKAVIA